MLHQSLEPEDAAKVFIFSPQILGIQTLFDASCSYLQVLEVAVDHDPTESVGHLDNDIIIMVMVIIIMRMMKMTIIL